MSGVQLFNQASFLISAAKLTQLPEDAGKEVAFVGRSNSGKSSAINAITSIKGLARTSKTPGRTQLMNCFALDDHSRLVDLPGYGFAKVPQSERERWRHFINDYLAHRVCLSGLVLLMDVRHPLKDSDQAMIDWAVAYNVPLLLLLTKADKLKRGALKEAERSVKAACPQDNISVLLFSALQGVGIEEARDKLRDWLS